MHTNLFEFIDGLINKRRIIPKLFLRGVDKDYRGKGIWTANKLKLKSISIGISFVLTQYQGWRVSFSSRTTA